MRMTKLSDFLKVSGLVLLVVLVVALSACSGGGGEQPTPVLPTAVGGGEVRELPTAPAGEEVGVGSTSGALDSPEATWGNYVRDMIAELNQAQASKISLLERYEAPSITQQNLGGLVKEVKLVADRSEVDVKKEGVAVVAGDFDVQLTFANGDADTRTCTMTVEIDEFDGTWYVLSPQPLAVFSVCSP